MSIYGERERAALGQPVRERDSEKEIGRGGGGAGGEREREQIYIHREERTERDGDFLREILAWPSWKT